jgi:hypothetical protein
MKTFFKVLLAVVSYVSLVIVSAFAVVMGVLKAIVLFSTARWFLFRVISLPVFIAIQVVAFLFAAVFGKTLFDIGVQLKKKVTEKDDNPSSATANTDFTV